MAGSGAAAILAAGTEEQKRYYLPKLISGEFYFAHGFTEPRGGADLASLQCRAVRDGDDYVINGQKMYTSFAHYSSHIYLMARTNQDVPKHKGISIFLVPMDTPGITMRPLWTIQNDPPAPAGTTYGMARTNEIFFDDVRVHKSCLLGKENEGWGVGAMGLNLDRVGAHGISCRCERDEDIVNWVKESGAGDSGGHSPAQDPAIRDKIAELWIEAQVCRLMTMRSMSIVEHGGQFSYEGSAEKVWAPEHGVKTTRGDRADARALRTVAERLSARDQAGRVCAQPDGRVPVGDQPRQRADHARPGGPPRARHAARRQGLVWPDELNSGIDMDVLLNEDETMIRDTAREYLAAECTPALVRADGEGSSGLSAGDVEEGRRTGLAGHVAAGAVRRAGLCRWCAWGW